MDSSSINETFQSNNQEERNRQIRKWLLIVTAIYVPVYGGALFGWGPMQLMLEENGAFEGRCSEDEKLPCASQTSRLLNVQFIALLTMMFAPLFGILSDKHGPLALMWFVALCGCIGLALLTIATGLFVDDLLFVAFIILGCMAVSTSIMIVETGLVFEGKTRQRIISVLNTLYDSGALVYLGLWGIKQATGATLALISGIYLGTAILCYSAALYLWSKVVPVSCVDDDDSADEATDIDDAIDTSRITSFIESHSSTATNVAQVAGEEDEEEKDPPESAIESTTEEDQTSAETVSDYVLISERTHFQQLRSSQYILLVIFFAFYGARNVFTLTTARDFLAYLGDDETGNKYLTIFTLLTPASILGLPFMDWIVNHRGYHAALQSINILAFVHGVIQISSENLNVQVLGFIVFSFFRCFLFTIVFSFLPTFMGLPVVGRAAGIMTCAFGALSFINIPLANLAVNQFDGNFFWPNLFYTIAVIPFVFVAWCLGCGINKEEAARNKR